jgi:glycosyltransferase involved in cell wall biosynthesis
MLSNPKITVLMPVYNCELYIREAVDSILNQTFTNFEFLIIDDASTDATVAIIKTYNDPRIQLIEKPKNSGYTNSLNYGLSIAKGEYIARMDGDDISLPERFAKQVAFLDANRDAVLCGALYQIIGTNKICNHPLTHEEIKVKLISGCYIAHPTVMFRKAVFEKNKLEYDPKMEPAEDYDLWSRLVFLGEVANIGEVLLHYRVHSQQTSIVRSIKQNKVSREIRIRMLEKVTPILNSELYPLDFLAQGFENDFTVKELKERMKLLDCLVVENNIKKIYSSKLFFEFVKGLKTSLCYSFRKNPEVYSFKNLAKIVFDIPVFFSNIGIKESGKFVVRCFFYRKKTQPCK